MRTKIFITIDTEFSIGGVFDDPVNNRPIGAQNVLCNVDGRAEGLDFMLETFEVHGIRATFFVEALHTAWFGDQPMGDLAQRIARAGHDLQLHLHPVWTYFDTPGWRERLASQTPTDNMHGRSVAQLTAWMRRGFDTFARWGLAAPVALRTGNLMVDRNVYRAMREVGLKVASNVGRAVFEPEERALRLNLGIHDIEGIAELPVLSYAGLRFGSRLERKALTITGSSVAETICLLERAYAIGSPAVVLLTHCHEFVQGDMQGRLRVNRLNQSRLVALCRFLRDGGDRFEVATMDRMAVVATSANAAIDPLLRVPLRLALARAVQNKLSDRRAP